MQMDLCSMVNKAQSECLNASEAHPLEQCLQKGSGWLESDTDAQVWLAFFVASCLNIFLCTIHRKLFLVLFNVRLYSTAQGSMFHVDNASLRSLPIPGFPAPSHFSGERKTVIFRSP